LVDECIGLDIVNRRLRGDRSIATSRHERINLPASAAPRQFRKKTPPSVFVNPDKKK
jgi:hypothetical protein